MNLSSEEVHWLGGAAFTIVALLLMARQLSDRRGSRWDLLLPLLLIGYGLETFADRWVHGIAVPPDYAQESAQHLWQGAAMLLAGLVQGLAVRGLLRHWAWQLAPSLGLSALALGFLFHAGHGASPIGMALMAVQHRAFAASLGLAALARALAVWPWRGAPPFALAWTLPLLNFGLQMLMYREAMPTMTAG